MVTDEEVKKLNKGTGTSTKEKQAIQQRMGADISTRADLLASALKELDANHPKTRKIDQIKKQYEDREKLLDEKEKAVKELAKLKQKGKDKVSAKDLKKAEEAAEIEISADEYAFLSKKNEKEVVKNPKTSYKVKATPAVAAALRAYNYQNAGGALVGESGEDEDATPAEVGSDALNDKLRQSDSRNRTTLNSILKAQKLQTTVEGIVNITAAVTTLTSSVSGLYDEITSHKDITEMD